MSSRVGRSHDELGHLAAEAGREPGHLGRRLGGGQGADRPVLAPRDRCLLRLAAPELGRGVDGEHAAAGDDPDPVGELLGLVEVVRGQHDGRAVAGQPGDQPPEVAPRLGVEPGGRLVEEEQLGPADDAERDVEAAPLPARELRGAAVALLRQPDGLEDLVDVAGVPIDLRGAGDHLAHRQQVESLRALEHDAQPLPPVEPSGLGVLPQDAHLAAVAAAEPLEDLHGRGLPGAVGAEQREDLSVVDLEVDAGDGGDAPIALVQALDLDRCAHAPTLAAPWGVPAAPTG